MVVIGRRSVCEGGRRRRAVGDVSEDDMSDGVGVGGCARERSGSRRRERAEGFGLRGATRRGDERRRPNGECLGDIGSFAIHMAGMGNKSLIILHRVLGKESIGVSRPEIRTAVRCGRDLGGRIPGAQHGMVLMSGSHEL